MSQLIEYNRHQLAVYANSTLTALFWQGNRINAEILDDQLFVCRRSLQSRHSL
ncbi:MAG: hypothetical protein JSS78_08820 [Bacteroidetes bacterium]|nr:hypothetical protein [Bacteroidota bacterium]